MDQYDIATCETYIESLTNSLKVTLHAIKALGPAAETLSSLLQVSRKGTFVEQAKIAEVAMLPFDTVVKHLATLTPDWVENDGREKTSKGYTRRTPTRRPTRLALRDGKYILIPQWARGPMVLENGKSHRLRWAEKVLLGIVCSRVAGIAEGTSRETGSPHAEMVENEDRYRFGLWEIKQMTGLSSNTVTAAKRSLNAIGLIDWSRHESGNRGDYIVPNFEFCTASQNSDSPLSTIPWGAQKWHLEALKTGIRDVSNLAFA